jgi:tRNA U55 pseudouridine synthase TruB
VHVDGRRSYELAREGSQHELSARRVRWIDSSLVPGQRMRSHF